jgi:hypothetical protein
MLELDHVHLPLESTTHEITRICRELESLVMRQPRAFCREQATHSPLPTNAEFLSLAESLLRERRLRERYFQSVDFGEPVWDILLDLYVSQLKSRKVSVSSACIAASVPATTALRYISMLTSQGVLIRVLDTHDARRVFLILSDQIQSAIREYLRDVHGKRYVSL